MFKIAPTPHIYSSFSVAADSGHFDEVCCCCFVGRHTPHVPVHPRSSAHPQINNRKDYDLRQLKQFSPMKQLGAVFNNPLPGRYNGCRSSLLQLLIDPETLAEFVKRDVKQPLQFKKDVIPAVQSLCVLVHALRCKADSTNETELHFAISELHKYVLR